MKLHELKPNPGARKNRLRRGRGNGSNYGTFSGRGCKGQNSRSGGGVRPGFEGGQSTLLQRMPKRRGFTNRNRVEHTAVNLDVLEQKFVENETVSLQTLQEKRVLRSNAPAAKILARGKLSKKLTVTGLPVSATAKAQIEKAGGKVEIKKSKQQEVKKKEGVTK